MGGVVDTAEGCAAIQKDLVKLEKWAHRNLSKAKCKVLHLRRNNPMYQYTLGERRINRLLSMCMNIS